MLFYDMRKRNNNPATRVEKYGAIWMNIAILVAEASTAKRRQVGCAIVTPAMGVYTGYNGTVSGSSNNCELENGETDPEVYHAEENALDKMLAEGISAKGSIVYLTLSPCINCAKRIKGSGIERVYYKEEYKSLDGVDFLNRNGVECLPFNGIGEVLVIGE